MGTTTPTTTTIIIDREDLEELQAALSQAKNISRFEDTMAALAGGSGPARMQPVCGGGGRIFDAVDGDEGAVLKTRDGDVLALQPLVDGGHLGAVAGVAVPAVRARVD